MPQNFDNEKQQYLNKLALRGIELDGDQLTKLNTYISNQKSQDMGLTNKTFSAPLISAPSGNTTKRAPLGQAVHGAPEGDSSLLKTLGVGLWYGLESYLWESPGAFRLEYFNWWRESCCGRWGWWCIVFTWAWWIQRSG